MLYRSLLSALYLIAGVSANASLEYSYLKKAFGHEHVSQHYASEDVYLNAANARADVSVASDLHFMCVPYADAAEFHNSLQAEHGQEGYQLLYIEEGDAACYVFRSQHDSVRTATVSLRASDEVTSIALPLEMKLMPGLMDALADDSLDWKKQILEVTFGLGNGQGVPDTLYHLIQHVKEAIRTGTSSSSSSLPTARMLHTSSSLFREAHAASYDSSDVYSHCGFDTLHYKKLGSFAIAIHGLQHLHSAHCRTVLAASIAAYPETYSVNVYEQMHIINDYVSSFVQSGEPPSASSLGVYASEGLTGDGVIVGVADTGVDEDSCFFSNADGSKVARSSYWDPTFDTSKRKVIQYVSFGDDQDDPNGGHGTHVCGTIAGQSLGSYTQYNGVAPDAKIAFFDIGETGEEYLYVPSLSTYVVPAVTSAGATLFSNSWGGGVNVYTSFAVEMDNVLRDNEELLAFFAAGNYGATKTVISPAISKNVVSVGSSGTGHGAGLNSLSSYSSRGPTYDGRYGIDVLAQGAVTYSALSSHSCFLIGMSGTSMATPAVAGAAALAIQYFEDSDFWASHCNSQYANCGVFTPSGSLLKTLLIHSGESIQSTFPNSNQGFGRVQLSNALIYDGITDEDMDLFLEDFSLSTSSSKSFKVQVPSNGVPLKVTISWMDAPNSVNAAKQLLNDINLLVTPPAGAAIKGNMRSSYDSKNNVEVVLISSPVAGEYVVTVSAPAVLSGGSSQLVSIVITSGGYVGDNLNPTLYPTPAPSATPTVSFKPTHSPTPKPSVAPTPAPSRKPTIPPSPKPSKAPKAPKQPKQPKQPKAPKNKNKNKNKNKSKNKKFE